DRPAPAIEPQGHLHQNLVHFGRMLRHAGLPVGPSHTIDAIHAIDAVGIARRDDFFWALHAVYVRRRDQFEVFEQAFDLFWRDPFSMNKAMALLLPHSQVPDRPKKENDFMRRVQEAFQKTRPPLETPPKVKQDEDLVDMRMTFSDTEVLRAKDFDQMSADEIRKAQQLIRKMRLPILDIQTRRPRPAPRGRQIDMRRTLKATLRSGGKPSTLLFKQPQKRPTPLVVLCDISGSMERYSRMFLHFLHALTNDRDRVHTFTFGTRLNNVTRTLRNRDPDVALHKLGQEVLDWSGGTRIGECLRLFNRKWSRRVLGQGAVVLLMTDGLDRDPQSGLAFEAQRLQKSCRRLIWLNPLLRFEGFEPKAGGVRKLLPYVDAFRPVHNLRSLAQIADALSATPTDRRIGGERSSRYLPKSP
ncbi:MAG: VWA domain-containing protein, partial [Myxococcota bacterium]